MRPLLLAALVTLTFAEAKGGTELRTDKSVMVGETPFDKGKWELQSSSGAYFSVGSGDRSTLNYSSTSYRLGIMLYTPEGEGVLRGNCELLLALLGGSVFDGPGNYLGGAAIMLRYNFVQPEARWVPYIQIGVGSIYNDVYKDRSQRLIGQAWEYDLEAALGIRYFFNERWSANLEGGYRHISNGDTDDRNVGLNSIGATIGLGLHF